MKESYWGYVLIFIGVLAFVVMMIVRDYQTTNDNDYYTVKEVLQDAMIDSVDYAYWREYGQLKIIKEKFAENFLRRFAHVMSSNKTYKIQLYGINEVPPKASVKIITKTDNYVVSNLESDDVTNFDVVTIMSGILDSKDYTYFYTSSNSLTAYTVNVVVQNGTASNASQIVYKGDDATITTTPNTNYAYNSYSCSGTATITIKNGTLYLKNIKSDVNCTVKYVLKNRVNMTVVRGTSNKAYDYVEKGGTVSFNITPGDTSYKYPSIECTGVGDSSYNNKVVTISKVSSDMSCTLTFNPTCDYKEGDVVFKKGYSGSVDSYELKCPGSYKLEVWGAQGQDSTGATGGKGGYSYGIYDITKPTTLYIGIGGQAKTFNGGRAGTGYSVGSGGATHIALANGQLSSLSSYRSKILLVAGGGGGASYYSAGGAGGGANNNGLDGAAAYYSAYSSGGKGGTDKSGGITENSVVPGISGSFGLGGYHTELVQGYLYGSAGGGGWFGGGPGGIYKYCYEYYWGYNYCNSYIYYNAAGGGGSGHINSSKLNSAGGTSGKHSGDGKAKITYLGNTTNTPTISSKDYIYNRGNEYDSITGGWTVNYVATKSTNSIKINPNYYNNNGQISTNNQIDLSDYSKLCVEIDNFKINNNYNYYYYYYYFYTYVNGNYINNMQITGDGIHCFSIEDLNSYYKKGTLMFINYFNSMEIKSIYLEE